MNNNDKTPSLDQLSREAASRVPPGVERCDRCFLGKIIGTGSVTMALEGHVKMYDPGVDCPVCAGSGWIKVTRTPYRP